jgi:hypothetical protein
MDAFDNQLTVENSEDAWRKFVASNRTIIGVPHLDLAALLDEDQVWRITGRSKSSLRRDRRLQKGIPFIRLGRLIRYHPAAVYRTLVSCQVEVSR